MTADLPFYTPNLKPSAPRPRQPSSERLFSFRTPDDRRIVCELGASRYGVDAQFYIDREFYQSARFDTRELAIQRAELERQPFEKGGA